MAHHKRCRPRSQRAGCKLCKPWKINGYSKNKEGAERFSDHKRRKFTKQVANEQGYNV